MVQNDRFSGEKKLIDQGDPAAVAGPYGSSFLGPQVNAGMGTLRLPVDDSPRSKSPGQFSLHRTYKSTPPGSFVPEVLE
jgi:hypothetical protein